jgi:hypothetical protein
MFIDSESQTEQPVEMRMRFPPAEFFMGLLFYKHSAATRLLSSVAHGSLIVNSSNANRFHGYA